MNNSCDASDDTARKRTRSCKGWLLVLSIVAILAAPAHAQIPDATWIATEVNPANGHTYILLNLALGDVRLDNIWSNMEAAAVEIGGHLVTINDAAENQWIDDVFAGEILQTGSNFLWTGFNDIELQRH